MAKVENKLTGMLMNFAFEQIEKEAIKAFEGAITETVKDIERDAKSNCPVLTGEMRSKIYSGTSRIKNGKNKGNFIGYCKCRDKGAFSVEYGHGSYPPHPFMRSAIDKNKDGVEKKFEIPKSAPEPMREPRLRDEFGRFIKS